MNINFAEAIKAFRSSVKGSVRQTTQDYYGFMCQYVLKAGEIVGIGSVPIDTVTLENLQALVGILDDKAHFPTLGETSVTKIVKYLRRSFEWFVKRGWINQNVASELRFRRTHPRITQPYREDEIVKLLSYSPRTPSEYRDLCIWLILLDSGLRVGELCALTFSDLHANELTVRSGKGGKYRRVTLGGVTHAALTEYLDHHRPAGGEALFVTMDGRPLTRTALDHRLRAWAKRVGVEGTALHRFRATFATRYVMERGGDLVHLQALLGHTTLDMSRRYVHLAAEEEARLGNTRHSVVDNFLAPRHPEPVPQPADAITVQSQPVPVPPPSLDPTAMLGMMQMMMAGMMQMMMGAHQTTAAQTIGQPAVAPKFTLPSVTVNSVYGGE